MRTIYQSAATGQRLPWTVASKIIKALTMLPIRHGIIIVGVSREKGKRQRLRPRVDAVPTPVQGRNELRMTTFGTPLQDDGYLLLLMS